MSRSEVVKTIAVLFFLIALISLTVPAISKYSLFIQKPLIVCPSSVSILLCPSAVYKRFAYVSSIGYLLYIVKPIQETVFTACLLGFWAK